MAPDQQETYGLLSVTAFNEDDGVVMTSSRDHGSQSSGSSTASERYSGPSHAGLKMAASLPLPGTHAGDDLLHMLTGLSSPSFHNTLASPHKRGPAQTCPAAACTSAAAAATAAAASAFALSMAWAVGPADPSTGGRGCTGPRGHADGGVAGPLLPLEALSKDVALCCPCRQGPGCSWRSRGIAQSSGLTCLSTAAAGAPALSTRRGLYEGTVRGGSVRNTWIYVAAGCTIAG